MSALLLRLLACYGFADGFNGEGIPDPGTKQPHSAADTSYSDWDFFSDLVLTLPQAAQYPQTTVTFSYDAAPPSVVKGSGKGQAMVM
jgi:hypothetical protein